jgi:ADP-glucose pyrophosphorylase
MAYNLFLLQPLITTSYYNPFFHQTTQVMAYNQADYWADIGGSISSFYNFAIGMARDEIPFRLQQPTDTPFYHRFVCGCVCVCT